MVLLFIAGCTKQVPTLPAAELVPVTNEIPLENDQTTDEASDDTATDAQNKTAVKPVPVIPEFEYRTECHRYFLSIQGRCMNACRRVAMELKATDEKNLTLKINAESEEGTCVKNCIDAYETSRQEYCADLPVE